MYKFDWKQLNSCWNYDINQLDGAVSVCSSLSDNSQCGDDTSQSDSICSSATDNNQCGDETSESDVSDVSWDEEAYSALIQAVLVPAPALPGAPPENEQYADVIKANFTRLHEYLWNIRGCRI